MKRHLLPSILADFPQKMVLLSGPRQVGKTTMAKQIAESLVKGRVATKSSHNAVRGYSSATYLNYDVPEQSLIIDRQAWVSSTPLIILDEIHKKPDWKRYLKGVYDDKPADQSILVTGSARLDTFRQSGDSLAGRYFSYHLLPFSVRELRGHFESPTEALSALIHYSGFPEPLLAGSATRLARWQNQYFNDLVREDILEFSRIHEVRSMRLLVDLLRCRVGSPLSYQSLAQDLSISPATVRKYIDILQALFIVFLVHPYHRNIARALSKAPKLYFYDWTYPQSQGMTKDSPEFLGLRLENLVAVALLKHLTFLTETTGEAFSLHYVQTTTGKEIDFVLSNGKGELISAIEVKHSDTKISHALHDMAESNYNGAQVQAFQLVYSLKTPFQSSGVEVHPMADWLDNLAA